VPRAPATWALVSRPARIALIGSHRRPSLCSLVRPKSGHPRVRRLLIGMSRAELRPDTGLSINGRPVDSEPDGLRMEGAKDHAGLGLGWIFLLRELYS